MALEQYDFQYLRNEAEYMVFAELEKQLNAYPGDLCRCNECVVDMAAIALNRLRPLYRVSLLGTLYAHGEHESYAQYVTESVAYALNKVRLNPSHPEQPEDTPEQSLGEESPSLVAPPAPDASVTGAAPVSAAPVPGPASPAPDTSVPAAAPVSAAPVTDPAPPANPEAAPAPVPETLPC